jgi:hypothetical protein
MRMSVFSNFSVLSVWGMEVWFSFSLIKLKVLSTFFSFYYVFILTHPRNYCYYWKGKKWKWIKISVFAVLFYFFARRWILFRSLETKIFLAIVELLFSCLIHLHIQISSYPNSPRKSHSFHIRDWIAFKIPPLFFLMILSASLVLELENEWI